MVEKTFAFMDQLKEQGVEVRRGVCVCVCFGGGGERGDGGGEGNQTQLKGTYTIDRYIPILFSIHLQGRPSNTPSHKWGGLDTWPCSMGRPLPPPPTPPPPITTATHHTPGHARVYCVRELRPGLPSHQPPQ